MTTPSSLVQSWQERIRHAHEAGTPLHIRGSGSKDFYGPACVGEELDVTANQGIIEYEPSELVITVKGGTPLAQIEQVLAEKRQFLAFEPPHFGEHATIAGAIASGLAGPRRATAGAVKDFVLGACIVDGKGQHLRFGGQVMKNVAGYDVSRVLTGSFGSLGIIDELSLKVLPIPEESVTLHLALDQASALQLFNTLGGQPLPLSATAWLAGNAYIRLCGAPEALNPAIAKIGGERLAADDAKHFWHQLREQRHAWFTDANSPANQASKDGATQTLWRLSVPATTPVMESLGDEVLIEWGGAVRWLYSSVEEAQIRAWAVSVGGTATAFRIPPELDINSPFHPLPAPLLRLQQNLKRAFDPAGILNPGRLYPGAL